MNSETLDVKKEFANFDKAAPRTTCRILAKDFTYRYFKNPSCDLRNHLGTHQKEDFEYLDGRVCIIEPDDDDTFTDDVKSGLIDDMPSPAVIRDISGGHLAMMFDTDKFAAAIDDFMDNQKLN